MPYICDFNQTFTTLPETQEEGVCKKSECKISIKATNAEGEYGFFYSLHWHLLPMFFFISPGREEKTGKQGVLISQQEKFDLGSHIAIFISL